jgi:hypothetical protein
MGCGNAISLASKYDLKKIIPLLITIFERLNPSIQVEVVASIDGLLIEEEEKTNMFGVEASMEKNIHGHWLLGKCLCFGGWLYPHNVCMDPCLVEDP